MRLWHTDLIDVLPRQQLLGQWRELNSILKKQNRHILINFVYDYPTDDLGYYALILIDEMERRGYKINLTYPLFRVVDNILRKPIKNPFPDKMTDRYLRQCYYNLQEKYDCGDISDEEWKRIEDKVGGRKMKTREEQIAEMAKAMGDFEMEDAAKCDIELSEHLFAKGYRKQSDTVREFVEKIEEVAVQMRYEASKVYQGRNQSKAQFAFGEKNAIENLMEQINALAAEYGVEVKRYEV